MNAWIIRIGLEKYNLVKDKATQYGYIPVKELGYVTYIDFDFCEGETLARPKSLQGIETNNGWITLSGMLHDLPTDSTHCWFMMDDKAHYGRYVYDLKRFFLYDGGHYCHTNVTHYYPVNKPKPPIV